jgi:hypothetical protein
MTGTARLPQVARIAIAVKRLFALPGHGSRT